MADASRPDATANAADKDDLCLKMARALAVKARNAHIAGVSTTGQRCAPSSSSSWRDGDNQKDDGRRDEIRNKAPGQRTRPRQAGQRARRVEDA